MSFINYCSTILAITASKSNITQKHGCIAIKKGKIISPSFYNYRRNSMFGKSCCSAHSEMCVLNYLINSLWKEEGLSSCVLQGYEWQTSVV